MFFPLFVLLCSLTVAQAVITDSRKPSDVTE
jgi:hypothetical protein